MTEQNEKIVVLVTHPPEGCNGEFIHVWADEGLLDVIRRVPGVSYVELRGTRATVYLDRRYDAEEVEMAIVTEVMQEDSELKQQ